MLLLLAKALLLHPALLRQHISNYTQWLQAEVRNGVRHLIIALIAWLVCAAALFLVCILAGVALMLGIMHNQWHWILAAVPCVPLVAAGIACVIALGNQNKLRGLERFKQQIQADIALFKRTEKTP